MWIKPLTDDYFELVKRFPLVPIRDDRQLGRAHEMIDELSIFDEGALTEGQAAYLSVLCDLTTAYESPVLEAMTRGVTALDILQSLVEDHGISAAEVDGIIGRAGGGEDILAGREPMTARDAALFGKRFGLPAKTFLD